MTQEGLGVVSKGPSPQCEQDILQARMGAHHSRECLSKREWGGQKEDSWERGRIGLNGFNSYRKTFIH